MTRRYIYMQGDKKEYFDNIINKGDISSTIILPESQFGRISHSKDDSVYYYVSCYDENFEFFKMEMISPLMHGKNHIEDVYNNDPELTDYLIKHYIHRPKIPSNIRKEINRGNIKLLLFHGLEGYHNVNMNYISKLLDIDKDNIVFITGDYRYSKITKCPMGVTTMWINYWERNCGYIPVSNSPLYRIQLERYKKEKVKRPYLNTFYNRRVRDHRINIMSVMNKEKLLDKMIWSWGGLVDYTKEDLDNMRNENFINWCYVRITGEEYRESINEVLQWGNLQNGKPAVEDLQVNLVNTMNKEHLYNTYYQLICETWASNNSIFLSEKSFKPFALGQSFLSWSDAGTVRALRELGYDVFDDIFDHSYDDLEDDNERLMKLKDEVKRISTIGFDIFPKLVKDKKYIERLEHNNDNLRNSYSRNGIDFSYMEK